MDLRRRAIKRWFHVPRPPPHTLSIRGLTAGCSLSSDPKLPRKFSLIICKTIFLLAQLTSSSVCKLSNIHLYKKWFILHTTLIFVSNDIYCFSIFLFSSTVSMPLRNSVFKWATDKTFYRYFNFHSCLMLNSPILRSSISCKNTFGFLSLATINIGSSAYVKFLNLRPIIELRKTMKQAVTETLFLKEAIWHFYNNSRSRKQLWHFKISHLNFALLWATKSFRSVISLRHFLVIRCFILYFSLSLSHSHILFVIHVVEEPPAKVKDQTRASTPVHNMRRSRQQLSSFFTFDIKDQKDISPWSWLQRWL